MNQSLIKKLTFLILSFFIFFFSCTKIDKRSKELNTSFPINWSEKFFNLPANPNPALVRVADEIRRQNKKTGFLENFVRVNGFIAWEKADIVIKKHKRNIYAMENGSNDTIILLPTVPWLEEIVKSIVAVKMDGSISFRTYIDKYYASNGFDLDPNREKPNANDVVKKIIEFEKKLFGTEQYKITDKRLFKYLTSASSANESFIYKVAAVVMPDDGGQCLVYTAWTSEDNGVTWTEGDSWESPSCSPESNPIVGGGSVGVDWGWEPDPSWGDANGGPGTSGTNPVDCVPWFKLKEINGGYDYNTPPPCVPQILMSDTLPTLDSFIRKILHQESFEIKAARDSAWNHGYENNWEFFFYIIKKNDRSDTIGFKTDKLENEVSANKRLTFGKEVVGDYHIHQDSLPGQRHLHDPADIIAGNIEWKNKLYFRSYVDCGDTLYVLVTESLAQLSNFIRTHNLDSLQENRWAAELYTSSPTRRGKGRRLLLEVVGNSYESGLGLYQSVDADKLYFRKVN